MLAADLSFENRSLLESSLLELNNKISAHRTKTYKPALSSVEIFATLTLEEQQAILSNISTSVRILGQALDPEIYKTPREQEVARLKNAIRSFNLAAKFDDVFNVVSTDDVIEVYSISGVQLYRNMRFFKMCSYNILDLAVNSWDALYDKPSSVVEQTMKVIEKIFTSDGRPIPYGMQPFLQKEKFQYAQTLKTVRVTPRYLVPLYNPDTGAPAGAFATNTGEILAEGPNSNRFSTI